MHNKGFVLFIVLIFLQIFSLISLYSLTTLSAMTKSNYHLWQGESFRYQSRKTLSEFASKFESALSTCSIPITPANELASKPGSWWQLDACQEKVNGLNAFYTVELLGEDACATIANNNNLIARYYRITLLTLSDEFHGASYLLQSTITVPAAPTVTCQQTRHAVKAGQQAWREL
jgi:hypothetical protein